MGAGGLCLAVAFRPIWRRRVAPPEVRLATPREIPIQFESLEGGANRHGRGSAGRRQVGPRARASSKACLHPPGRIRRGGARRARG